MATYRVTIRYGVGSSQYEVLDVEAERLSDALRKAADTLPKEAETTADLAEIRLQTDPETREYTEG